ncbi:ARM repeat-containing protein [Patellaria atrata CBS 101060]|uniref:ARM repeat-containing protein n=1 Tax=Patellaria atrata CBS 101060 TaxID=1346257 RepID=A0A9P4S678_9PEZI|nr:ARM repeat-containing protein [Patellaria atrata CBS 101060]
MEVKNNIFQLLKPKCVRLSQAAFGLAAKRGNVQDVVDALEELLAALRSVTNNANGLDDKLANYVFFPISHVLRESQQLSLRGLELSLECLSILLLAGWQRNIEPTLAQQLLILLTFFSDSSAPRNQSEKTSEELQNTAFQCLGFLSESLRQTSQGRNLLITIDNIPTLGRIVTVMIEGITDGPSDAVQRSALHSLHSLTEAIPERDALASFFPGIISALTKVLTPKSIRRTAKLLAGCLDLFNTLIQNLLSDKHTKDLPTTSSKRKGGSMERVERTTSWLRATAAQVRMALANVMRLRDHSNLEVRKSLSKVCISILKDCISSLSESFSLMIDTLITLAGTDEDGEIREAVTRLLSKSSNLTDLLKSSLHDWIVALPRIMQSTDEDTKAKSIHRISSAYEILAEKDVDMTLIYHTMAGNLRSSVYNAIKQSSKVRDVSESEQVLSTSMISDGSETNFHRVVMAHGSQRETIRELGSLIERINKYGPTSAITRELLDAVHYSEGDVLLSNFWLVLNFLQRTSDQNFGMENFLDLGPINNNARNDMLEELYSFSLCIVTDATSSEESDWRLQSLALEVLALQSQEYGENFRGELVDALYPVVHLIGSSNQALRKHAMTCLDIMSTACGYIKASDMIIANADYLVNAVALKLNSFDISPQAPQVLLMMIKLSGPNLLPYLDDLIGSIFAALENFHGYPKLVELLFSVLRGIAEEGAKNEHLAITDSHIKSQEPVEVQSTSISGLVELIKRNQKRAYSDEDKTVLDLQSMEDAVPRRPWKELRAGEGSDENDQAKEEDEVPPTDAAEPQPPAPKTYELLLKISLLTQHYLPSSSPTLRTSLFSLLETTIPVLARHENSFLPLINTLWPVLVSRLDDPEAYIVTGSLDVMAAMCKHAGNFMRSRIEDIWGDISRLYRLRAIKNTLISSHSSQRPVSTKLHELRPIVSVAKTTPTAVGSFSGQYIHTPTKMIFESVIRLCIAVVEYVEVNEETFDDVVELLEPIIEERPNLQDAIERRDPDGLWLMLIKRRIARQTQEDCKDYDREWFVNLKLPESTRGWKFAEICS